jgi:multicomponent Na+:H+ antiporter subunit D
MGRRLAFPLGVLLGLTQLSLIGLQFLPSLAEAVGATSDRLDEAMLLTIGLVTVVASIVGQTHFDDDIDSFNFQNLLLLLVASMNGVVLTHDLFTLYVFLEATAIVSFVLIAVKKDLRGLEGSFKYIIFTSFATMLLLSGIALLLLSVGTLNMNALVTAMAASAHGGLYVKLGLGLFLVGLLIKSGLVPFHAWVPDAYASAPAPSAVLLGGIITKIAGVYVIIRWIDLSSAMGETGRPLWTLLLTAGVVSMIIGGLLALVQTDMNRMLAYSSISQIGYILLALGAHSKLGVAAAIFHFFNHAVLKSLLFVNSAALESQTGSRDMEQSAGLGNRMPWTSVTSVIGSMSTAGIPPLSGFWSKLLIIIALWLAGYKWLAIIATLASLLTLAYFLRLQRKLFFGHAPADSKVTEAKIGYVIPAVVLALITVGLGVGFPFVIDSILVPVKEILP